MSIRNKEVDVYIENAREFARPILRHLRAVVHSADPSIEETIKWGMPHFEYKGVICTMAAFKAHCAFGFWKEALIPGMKEYIREKEAMGSWGRIETISDLPSDDDIRRFVKAAIELNEKGIKVPKQQHKAARNLKIPDYFAKALKANKKAQEVFENFSFTNKNEYVEWLTDAKTEETRERRLEQAIEWISKGKIRNWKYVR